MSTLEAAVRSSDQSELHLSAKMVSILLVITGLAVFLSGDFWSTPPPRFTILVFSLSLLVAASGLWFLSQWIPPAGQWVAILLLIGAVYIGSSWFQPAFQVLLTIPIILATSLVGLGAALIATVLTTILLVLPGQTGATDAPTVAALWCTYAAVAILYHPVPRITQWFSEQYRRIDELLKEATEQRAELKQRMDDLQHANRQLALLNERIAVMRQVAEEAQKAKAEFVARVSHEFRTPLNMIIGVIDLVMETPEIYGERLPPGLIQDLQIVHRNCDHLSSMINDILDLSRTEAARLTLHYEWVCLAEEIQSALAVAQPLMVKKGLRWETRGADGLPLVYCDRTRVRQVIVNLVSNAVRFTDAGSILVQANLENGEAVIRVSDTGRGIPVQDVGRIFEPFYQSPDSSPHTRKGTGLGLTISRNLVEMHGGRIWATSEPGRGSTFTFTLPLGRPERASPTPASRIRPESRWSGRRVSAGLGKDDLRRRLVVCDQTDELFLALVQDQSGCEFVHARNLPEVQGKLTECPAHAVLLNASAPADAWSLLEQAQSTIQDTPLVVCSVPPPVIHRGRLGIVAWLVKPVRAGDLRKALASVNRRVARVLIVNEDPDVIQLTERMLTAEDPWLQISSARAGEQALELLSQQQIDLVLLDSALPGMGAAQVLERKSQDPVMREVPVIVVSAQEPDSAPKRSPFLMATIGQGISVNRLLRGSLALSSLWLEPPTRDPEPQQTDVV